MIRNTRALLLVVFLALACGSSEPVQQSAEDERNARLTRAMGTLDAAPAPVREEVLKTCDKWGHFDHPCVDEDARIDQLECWLQDGLPHLQQVLSRRMGPRARNVSVLLKQNLCMEKRRWRKLERGPDL